jgi:parallel beta-helix repeat protein
VELLRKTVSGIMLTLLLISMLTLAFKIQPAKGWTGTVYIRADGSIDPPTAPISTVDNVTYTLTGNITSTVDGIVVERSNIIIDGAGYTLQGPGFYPSGSKGMNLSSITNVTIQNINIENFYFGVYLDHSSSISIIGNNITANSDLGIYLEYSSSNSITENNITGNNNYGVYLSYSPSNSITGNNITDNSGGVCLSYSSSSNITGNTFWHGGLTVSNSYGNVVVDNLANGKPLAYLEGVSDMAMVEDAGQIILVDCNRIRVENLNLSSTDTGIELWKTNNTIITGNNITNNRIGIEVWHSSNNIISGNNITKNDGAIFLFYSSYCMLYANNITNNSGDYTINLAHSSNNTIEQNILINNRANPIIYLLDGSSYNIFANNLLTVDPSPKGIWVSGNYNVITGNTITNASEMAILLYGGASDNQIYGNTVKNNAKGIAIGSSSNNVVYHNNFVNNSQQVYDYSWTYPEYYSPSINVWDDGYPSGGNYWSDYTGVDANGDGIGDIPYVIDADNQDRYPLMHLWSPLPVHNINTGLGYPTIQEAINAPETLNGHTIFVEAGAYYENVVVDKAISLVGEDKIATVLCGNKTGAVVRVIFNNVTVTGFTIQNGYSGVVLDHSDFSIITGNIVLNNQLYGIECYRSNNNVIENNFAFNNSRGIKIHYSNHTKLMGNNASNNWYGVRIRSSMNNTLRNNTMTGNHWNFAIDADYLSELTHDIDTSNTVDGKPIIYWINKHDQHVPTNAGFVAAINCSRVTVKNVNLVKNNIGVLFWSTSNSTIEGVNISDNWVGAVLISSEKITLFNNTISNSAEEGIIVVMSNNSRIIKNNFVNNGYQIYTYESFNNIWDDGYPSGGNYWSNYTGVDTDNDGIGDEPHTIDANNTDRYPLVGPINVFDAGVWNGIAYNVDVVSNSTVSEFQFNPSEGALLRFNVTGDDGTSGFCRVTIPKSLLWVEDGWTITVGDQPITDYTLIPDENYTYLYFTYNHTTKTVEIQGTHVIPEFPSTPILMLLMLTTLIATILLKKKRKRQPP